MKPLTRCQNLPAAGWRLPGAKRGKHKANVGCIYINKLADVDLRTLEMLIKTGIALIQRQWGVSAA